MFKGWTNSGLRTSLKFVGTCGTFGTVSQLLEISCYFRKSPGKYLCPYMMAPDLSTDTLTTIISIKCLQMNVFHTGQWKSHTILPAKLLTLEIWIIELDIVLLAWLPNIKTVPGWTLTHLYAGVNFTFRHNYGNWGYFESQHVLCRYLVVTIYHQAYEVCLYYVYM
jgi:hypothetical protein